MYAGLTLMLVGMTIVFSFLVLLVISTKLMSVTVMRFFPEKEEAPKRVSVTDDVNIAVALTAVKIFQKRKKG